MAYRQFNCDIQLAGGSSLLYPRVHPDTAANIAGTKRNGQMFFETAVGAKRLQVYDESIAAFALVPRLDYGETVTGLWNFSRSGPPFAIGGSAIGTCVAGLNAQGIPDKDDVATNTMRLGSVATAVSTVAIRTSAGRLKAATPYDDDDCITLAWAYNYLAQRVNKGNARVCATTNIATSGLLTVDDVVLVAGDIVLRVGQTNPAQNGVFIVQVGAWARLNTCDSWIELISASGNRAYIWITEGTEWSNTGWLFSSAAGGTIDVTGQSWIQVDGKPPVYVRNGLLKDGNTLYAVTDADYAPNSLIYTSGAHTLAQIGPNADPAIYVLTSVSSAKPVWTAVSALTAPQWWGRDVGSGTVSPTTITDKVGIGIAAADANLHVYSAGYSQVLIEGGTAAHCWFKHTAAAVGSKITAFVYTAGGLDYKTFNDAWGATATLVTFTHGGNVGIGDTTAAYKLTIGTGDVYLRNSYSAGATPPVRRFFATTQNSGAVDCASSGMEVAFTWLANTDYASELRFYTAADNTPVERMRITSAGGVSIGGVLPGVIAGGGRYLTLYSDMTASNPASLELVSRLAGSRISFVIYDWVPAASEVARIESAVYAGAANQTGQDLVFSTRKVGSSLAELVRFGGLGNVGIKNATPERLLDVGPDTANSYNAHVRIGSWCSISGDGGGRAFFGNNMYYSTDSVWRWTNTHPSLGGCGLLMGVGTFRVMSLTNVATTKDASCSPVCWLDLDMYAGHLKPGYDAAQDFGAVAVRWRSVYCGYVTPGNSLTTSIAIGCNTPGYGVTGAYGSFGAANDSVGGYGQIALVGDITNANAAAGQIKFYQYTNSVWTLRANFNKSGHFLCGSDGAYDLGQGGGSPVRWRCGYFSYSVETPCVNCGDSLTNNLVVGCSFGAVQKGGVINLCGADGAGLGSVQIVADNRNASGGSGCIYFYQYNGVGSTLRALFNKSGHFTAGLDNTYDLGSVAIGWRNSYFTGTVTANTFFTLGTRPVTVTNGSVTIKGDAGGWVTSYGFTGSAGADLGGFGMLGGGNALTYYFVGNYAGNMTCFTTAAIYPSVTNTTDLGAASLRFKNGYFSGEVTTPILNGGSTATDKLFAGCYSGTTVYGALIALWGKDNSTNSAYGKVEIISDIRNANASSGFITFCQYDGALYNLRAWFDKAGHFNPGAANTYDLGNSSYTWRNLYLNLANGILGISSHQAVILTDLPSATTVGGKGIARKASVGPTQGNSSWTTLTLTHGLGTAALAVTLLNTASGVVEDAQISIDSTSVVATFNTAPANTAWYLLTAVG